MTPVVPATMTPATTRRRGGTRSRPGGMVLLALLIALVLLAIGLMGAIDMWTVARQREREQELLFIGDQYRQAITRYYRTAPAAGARGLPPSLEALLEDDRFPVPAHHLRRAYADPITGSAEWGLLRAGDRILGVYSLSEKTPLKAAGFPALYKQFESATSYRDWVFAARLQQRGGIAPAAAPASSPAPSPGSRSPIFSTPLRRSPP